jgi:UDP-N-acetylmuramyl pentapeptide phosphotransferase/UDP-N-acetylglucosamine-1-phosphate transferase
MRRSLKALVLLSAAAIALVLVAQDASAQCSMCRAALAGSNNAFFIRNFNIGVLVLLVPPVTMFCSIFVVLKRYHLDDQRPDSEEHE